MKFLDVDKWEMDILYKRLPKYLHFATTEKMNFLVLIRTIINKYCLKNIYILNLMSSTFKPKYSSFSVVLY